jgi:hypothetical protein
MAGSADTFGFCFSHFYLIFVLFVLTKTLHLSEPICQEYRYILSVETV